VQIGESKQTTHLHVIWQLARTAGFGRKFAKVIVGRGFRDWLA
jgi:hypothetical protein